ncbi:MAG: methyl-accepting chemotaxis protein [Thermodesulfobacteriota bacterium]
MLVKKEHQDKRVAQEKVRARTLAKQQANAERLAAASEELSAAIEESNAASAQLNDLMGGVAAAAEKMNQIATHLQEAAQTTSRSVGEVRTITEQYDAKNEDVDKKTVDTTRAISELAGSVDATTKRVLDSATVINQLKTKAENISGIVQVVTRIADQTNLLALNAAIEAARAGDHGKGFAVVADEVRTLAEVSESSAHKIKDVIDDALNQVARVVSSVSAFESISATNKRKTGVIAGACNNIRHQSSQITAAVRQIKQISIQVAERADQTCGNVSTMVGAAEQIAASCDQIRQSTSEQVKAFSEASAAANDLATMADDLKSSVDISKSAEEVAAAAEELAATVEEMDNSADEIERAISEVAKGSRSMADTLGEVSGLANTTLADLAAGDAIWEEIAGKGRGIQQELEHIKCLDHLLYIEALEKAITDNTPFKGQLDPHKCAFGCWYDHYQPEDGEEQLAYDEIREHHDAVHHGARDVVRAMADGRLDECRAILDSKIRPAVEQFRRIFERFHHGIEMVTDGIKNTIKNNQAIMEEMAVLDKEFSKVNKIVDTITNVAIQTNMLAVNGHIEAARAGEFGRGFSVVAGDIRSLANESADNAEKMREILDDVRDQIALAKGDIANISTMIQVQIERANVAVEALVEISRLIRETRASQGLALVRMKDAHAAADSTNRLVEDSAQAVEVLVQNSEQSGHAAAEQIKGIKEIALTAEDVASLADEMQNA